MKVKANQKGWYNKRIIKEGEVFEFMGKDLPQWVEKVGGTEEKSEPKEPEKKPEAKPNNKNTKPENKNNETLIEKNKQIQNVNSEKADEE